MNISMDDSRSLTISRVRNEVEIWLNDSLTRTQKLLALYRGGKYHDVDPELFSIIKDPVYGSRLMKEIRQSFDEPQAEFNKRWTCFKRSILLHVLLLKRSI